MYIAACQYRLMSSQHMDRHRAMFASCHIFFHSYSWKWHNQHNAVYCRVSFKCPQTYVGSTKKTSYEREQTRTRKFKQLTQNKLVQVEPALIFWKNTGTFFQYIVITLKLCRPFTLLSSEMHLIQQMQPSLNAPNVYRLLNKKERQFTTKVLKPMQSPTSRRWLKVKQVITNKLGKHVALTGVCGSKHAWRLICSLCFTNHHTFVTSRYLKSARVQPEQLYALYRQSHHLSEPHRTQRRSQLKKIFKYKNLVVPKGRAPLVLPFLQISNFKSKVRQWLKDILHSHVHQLLPSHYPKFSVVQGATVKLSDIIYSWKSWLHKSKQLQHCECQRILRDKPWLPNQNGHIAGSFNECQYLPEHLQFLRQSASNMLALSKQNYVLRTMQLISKWQETHCFQADLSSQWEQFVSQNWQEHLEATRNNMFQFQHCSRFKQEFSSLVVHCEDHAPSSICVFCPLIYFKAASATFDNPEVFSKLSVLPSTYALHQRQSTPTFIKRHYQWGMSKQTNLPKAYIFIKRKKQWTTSRPIIAYSSTIYHKLLQVLGMVIFAITDKVYPQRLHQADSTTVLGKLHQFLQAPSSHELCLTNDDLVGFFTSVPHDRIIQSMQHAVLRYAEKEHLQGTSGHITVRMDEKNNEGRTFNGKFRKPIQHEYSLQLNHLQQLCEFAISSSHFQWCDTLYKQVQGAPIGGPASPAISHMVVSFEEQMWYETFQNHISSTRMLQRCFIHRYVDNRLIIFPKCFSKDPVLQILLKKSFYKKPIELEDVGDNHFLGFDVNVANRTVMYNSPTADWQYRHWQSAGSPELKLSSLSSRMYLLCRGTWPPEYRKQAAKQLAEQYSRRGFNNEAVQSTVNKILAKFN